MTKSKNFWAAAALVCLAAVAFAGYSIYGQMALHFSGDTLEVRTVPVPPLQETLQPEAAPTTDEQKAGEQKIAAAQPEPEKIKASRIPFTYKDAKAKSVHITGSFTSWKEQKMTRKNGVWKTEIYILPGTYPYHFMVDGKKKLDPGKPKAPTGDSLVDVN